MVGGDEIHDFAQVVRDGAGKGLGARMWLFAGLRGGDRLASVRVKGFHAGVCEACDCYFRGFHLGELAPLAHHGNRTKDKVGDRFTIHFACSLLPHSKVANQCFCVFVIPGRVEAYVMRAKQLPLSGWRAPSGFGQLPRADRKHRRYRR